MGSLNIVKYLSVCSGIEAASAAWHPLGWEAVAFSEIEPFPCAVLQHHYPSVPNLGDLTKYKEWPDDLKFDLLVGGTPCQSYSIAGQRQGLNDPRGQLMFSFLGVAGRYRPRWVVWENVPGVLSSGGGRDFGAFLGALGNLGYGWAYRVLDAQWFGVPQRRRRVFVVGCLGDQRRTAQVLFERESLRRDSPPSREAGKGTARPVAGSSPGSSGDRNDADRADDLIAYGGNRTSGPTDVATACNAHGGSGRLDFESETLIAHALRADGFDASEDGTGRGTPLAVAFHQNQRAEVTVNDTTGALNSGGGKPGQGYPAVARGMSVRRLTPAECEALQGFQRNYTLIPYRNKPAADGPRYKALGNSMAVPVITWLGRRIQAVEDRT